MSFADDVSDSSSNDLPISFLKQTLDNSFSQDRFLWPQIADKFRCLIMDFKTSAAIEFLESLLTFIRKGPKNCRKFNRSICQYLFAMKQLTSKEAVDKSYYEQLRKVLVLYCVLELRLISCFDDDSMIASDILLKIMLLMRGSTSISILDVLVDIDEQILAFRSKSIIKLVYRKYLEKTLAVGQRVLDDTDFVKHLILFRSWYNYAEAITEKVTVFNWFMSTIKPSQELRSNRSYSLLQIDDLNELDTYKKLLQHPLPRNALVMALRDAENENDNQDNPEHVVDLAMYDENSEEVKQEVGLLLHLPGEIITVDDDDDILEIGYLHKLFERLEDVDRGERQIAAQQNYVPSEVIDVSSDSENVENNEAVQRINAIEDASGMNSHNDFDPPDRFLAGLYPNNVKLKPYAGKSWTQLELVNRLQYRRKWCDKQTTTKIQPILRSRSFTATPLGKSKKVIFKDPLTTEYVCERSDSGDSASNVSSCCTSQSDLLSGCIVTRPKFNFLNASTSVAATTISHTETRTVENECSVAKNRKSNKRKRNYFGSGTVKRTSIDYWIKRKISTTTQHKVSEEERSLPNAIRREFSIPLNRLDVPLTGQITSAGQLHLYVRRETKT